MPQNADQSQPVIDEAIFEHLVGLAAFHLSEQEKAYLRRELNQQLPYLRRELNQQLRSIRELEALDIGEDVPITSHGVPYSGAIAAPLREDEAEVCPAADDILEQISPTRNSNEHIAL